jgi:hypothetical protein
MTSRRDQQWCKPFRHPGNREAKFKGKCAKLKNSVYDIVSGKDTFAKTTQEIAEDIRREFNDAGEFRATSSHGWHANELWVVEDGAEKLRETDQSPMPKLAQSLRTNHWTVLSGPTQLDGGKQLMELDQWSFEHHGAPGTGTELHDPVTDQTEAGAQFLAKWQAGFLIQA